MNTLKQRYSWVRAVAALILGGSATATAGPFPATGQTSCWSSTGVPLISCAGTGQDGAIQAGGTLNYKDNGNGTITDRNTRLVWEKKSDDEDDNDNNNTTFPHDKDNVHTWPGAFAVHIAILNNRCANDETVDCSANGKADCAEVGGQCGFAGKRDWRLPNKKELESIVNAEVFKPAVSAAFNTDCVAGVTVFAGSCTTSSYYWSSSTYAFTPGYAWFVDFVDGFVSANFKSNGPYVRAVRGGSP